MGFLKKAFKKLAKVSPGLKLGAKVDPVARKLVGSGKKRSGSSIAQAVGRAQAKRPIVKSPAPGGSRVGPAKRPVGGSFNSPRRMK